MVHKLHEIKKGLSPSIYASENAYFWLHRLKKLTTQKCEGYFNASVITEVVSSTNLAPLSLMN